MDVAKCCGHEGLIVCCFYTCEMFSLQHIKGLQCVSTSFERPIVLITKVGRHSNLSSDEDDHMDRVSVGSAGTFLLMPGGVSQVATCDLISFYVPLCRLGQPVRLTLDQSNCSISMSALI